MRVRTHTCIAHVHVHGQASMHACDVCTYIAVGTRAKCPTDSASTESQNPALTGRQPTRARNRAPPGQRWADPENRAPSRPRADPHEPKSSRARPACWLVAEIEPRLASARAGWAKIEPWPTNWSARAQNRPPAGQPADRSSKSSPGRPTSQPELKIDTHASGGWRFFEERK
jgi:hypothetical protein